MQSRLRSLIVDSLFSKPLLIILSVPFLGMIPLAAPAAASGAPEEKPWVEEIGERQYFAVSVSDMDRSAAWYECALGLTRLDDTSADDGRWRIVNLANDALFVELIWDRRAVDVERPRGFAKVGFEVPDVEKVADRVENAGLERPRVVEFQRHQVRTDRPSGCYSWRALRCSSASAADSSG